MGAGAVGITHTVRESSKVLMGAMKTAADVRSGRRQLIIRPSTIIIGLFVIAASLSFIQLAHYNKVSTKGYELRRLEADRQQLMTQYELKNMKVAEAKSMSVIAVSDKTASMVRPANVEYIRGNTGIASR